MPTANRAATLRVRYSLVVVSAPTSAGPLGHSMRPIEGMPDLERHRLCRRCQRWFEAEDGSVLAPEFTGPSALLDKPRFQCRRCTVIRKRTEAGLWLLLGAIVAAVLVAERLGFLS